eukprot:2874211-Amphidinium_carterae.1
MTHITCCFVRRYFWSMAALLGCTLPQLGRLELAARSCGRIRAIGHIQTDIKGGACHELLQFCEA